jgi:hypothetical protein
MADSVDLSGARMDITVRRGDTFTFTDTITVNGSAVTPTAARIAFKAGTLAAPGSAVSGVTGSATISSNTVTWGITTAAETRLFTAGSDYCYSYEVDLPSGNTQTLAYGVYEAQPEIA